MRSGKIKIAIGILIAIIALLIAALLLVQCQTPIPQDNTNIDNINMKYNQNGTNTLPSNQSYMENTNNLNINANQNANQQITSNTTQNDPNEAQKLTDNRREVANSAHDIAQNTQPLEGMDIMDRGQMHRTVADFIDVFCDTRDISARYANMGHMLDLDYIREHQDGLLYKDYYVYVDKAYGIPSGAKYLYHDDVVIDNAHQGNMTASVSAHYISDHVYTAENTGPSKSKDETIITYKVSLNDNYKIRSVKIIS